MSHELLRESAATRWMCNKNKPNSPLDQARKKSRGYSRFFSNPDAMTTGLYRSEGMAHRSGAVRFLSIRCSELRHCMNPAPSCEIGQNCDRDTNRPQGCVCTSDDQCAGNNAICCTQLRICENNPGQTGAACGKLCRFAFKCHLYPTLLLHIADSVFTIAISSMASIVLLHRGLDPCLLQAMILLVMCTDYAWTAHVLQGFAPLLFRTRLD